MDSPGMNVGVNLAVNFGTVITKSEAPNPDPVDANSNSQNIDPQWPRISVQLPDFSSEGHATPSIAVQKMEKQDTGYGDTITTNESKTNTVTDANNMPYRQCQPEAYLPRPEEGLEVSHGDKDSSSTCNKNSKGLTETRIESVAIESIPVEEDGHETTSNDPLSKEEGVQDDSVPQSETAVGESGILEKGSEDGNTNTRDEPAMFPETDLLCKCVSGLSDGQNGQDEIEVVEEGLEDFEEGELVNYAQGRYGTSSETFLSQMRFFGGRTWARRRGRRRGRARGKDVTNIALKLIETDQLEADSDDEEDKEKSDDVAFPSERGRTSGNKSSTVVPQRKSARITESKEKNNISSGIGRGINLRKETTRGRERPGGGRGYKTYRGGGVEKGRSLVAPATDSAEEEAVDNAEYESNDEDTLAAMKLSLDETEKSGRGRGLQTKRGGGQGKSRSPTASTADSTEKGTVDDIEYQSNDEDTLTAIKLSLEESEKNARGRGYKTKRGGGRGRGRTHMASAVTNPEEAVGDDAEYESNDEDTLAAIRLSLEEMNKNNTNASQDSSNKDDSTNKDSDVNKDLSAKNDSNGNMQIIDICKNIDPAQKSDEIRKCEMIDSDIVENTQKCDDMTKGQTEIKGGKPKIQNRRKKGRKRLPAKPKPVKEITAASLPDEKEKIEYESNDEDTQAAIRASLEELEKEKQRQMERDQQNEKNVDKETERSLENHSTVDNETVTNLENVRTVEKQVEINLENQKTVQKTKRGKVLKRKHPGLISAMKPTTTDSDVPESDEQNSCDSAAASDSSFQPNKRLRAIRKGDRQSPRSMELSVYPSQSGSNLRSLSAERQEERPDLPDSNGSNQTVQSLESVGMKLRTRVQDLVNYAENEKDGSSDISDFDTVEGTFLEVQDSPNAISVSSNTSNREEQEMSPSQNSVQKESCFVDVSVESEDDMIEQDLCPSIKSSTCSALQSDEITTPHLRLQKLNLKSVYESSPSQCSSGSVTPVPRKRAHNVTENEEYQDNPSRSKAARMSLSDRPSGSSKQSENSATDKSKATRKPQSDHQSSSRLLLSSVSDGAIADVTPLLSSTGLSGADGREESLTKSVGGMMSYLFGDKVTEECPNGFVVNVRLEVEKKKNQDDGSTTSNSSGTCCKTQKPEHCPCLQKLSDEKLAAVLKERVEKRRDLTIAAKSTLLASILNVMQELETAFSSC